MNPLLDPSRDVAERRVAFILPEFPNLTGTFYMNEIAEVRKHMKACVLAIRRGEQTQDVSDALLEDACFLEEGEKSLFTDHLVAAARRPLGYVRALVLALRGRRFGMLKRFRLMPFWARYLTRRGYTIMHAHFADLATEAAMMLTRLTGIPFSFSAHAYDIYIDPRWMRRKVREAKFVLTCTEYNRQYMLEHLIEPEDGPLYRQYHGLDVTKFEPKGRPPRKKGDGMTLLTIGRMVEKKGMIYVVRACALLAEKGMDFNLVMVGDGPLRDDLRACVRELGLEDRVTFPGPLRHEQLVPVYQESDCYVLPCVVLPNGDRDGIPNTIAEAMCMEVPVISTRISGIPELLRDGETGLAVDGHSAEAVADAITRFYEDPELAGRLAKAAHEQILDVFDVAKNSMMLVRLFRGEAP